MGPSARQNRRQPVRSTRQISDPPAQRRGPVALWEEQQQRSVPLALASLVLGSRRSEAGLFEIDSGELARMRRGHETHATRADRDNCFAMACADPSVPVGPRRERKSSALTSKQRFRF
jgi:hypothetical protein